MKILLIDNNGHTRKMLKNAFLMNRIVPSEEYIKESISPESGLEIFKSFKPDLVIMEINFQEVNGLDLCLQLTGINSECRIIVASNSVEPGIADEAIRYGAVRFFSKPFQANNIISYVKTLDFPSSTFEEVEDDEEDDFFFIDVINESFDLNVVPLDFEDFSNKPVESSIDFEDVSIVEDVQVNEPTTTDDLSLEFHKPVDSNENVLDGSDAVQADTPVLPLESDVEQIVSQDTSLIDDFAVGEEVASEDDTLIFEDEFSKDNFSEDNTLVFEDEFEVSQLADFSDDTPITIQEKSSQTAPIPQTPVVENLSKGEILEFEDTFEPQELETEDEFVNAPPVAESDNLSEKKQEYAAELDFNDEDFNSSEEIVEDLNEVEAEDDFDLDETGDDFDLDETGDDFDLGEAGDDFDLGEAEDDFDLGEAEVEIMPEAVPEKKEVSALLSKHSVQQRKRTVLKRVSLDKEIVEKMSKPETHTVYEKDTKTFSIKPPRTNLIVKDTPVSEEEPILNKANEEIIQTSNQEEKSMGIVSSIKSMFSAVFKKS